MGIGEVEFRIPGQEQLLEILSRSIRIYFLDGIIRFYQIENQTDQLKRIAEIGHFGAMFVAGKNLELKKHHLRWKKSLGNCFQN
jgi:hypothetical protein